MQEFDILGYLGGLTTFSFDEAVLSRVALECGVSEVSAYEELTEEKKDRCKIALFETVVFGPYLIASSSKQHGAWSESIGSQQVTAASLSSIKAELRRLYKKYGEDEKVETIDEAEGVIQWIAERD